MKYIAAYLSSYNEVPQAVPLKYSLVDIVSDTEIREHFSPVQCKDFLVDCVRSVQLNKAFYVYGFSSDPAFLKNKTKTELSIYFNGVKFNTDFVIKELNIWETMQGLSPSTVIYSDDMRFVVQGDSFWKDRTWALHLYAFMFKVINYYNCAVKDIPNEIKKQLDTNKLILTELASICQFQITYGKTHKYIEYINKEKKLLERLYRLFTDGVMEYKDYYFLRKEETNSYIHNYNGIMSLLRTVEFGNTDE